MSATRAASVLATRSRPDVPRSRRWTMPGRSGGPTSANSGNRARRPAARVPSATPAPGWTTMPGRLSTTITCPSRWTTSTSTEGSGATPLSGRSIRISIRCPETRRVEAFELTVPSSDTLPLAMASAASRRGTSAVSATTRSRRSPASASGNDSISIRSLGLRTPPSRSGRPRRRPDRSRRPRRGPDRSSGRRRRPPPERAPSRWRTR